MVRGQVIQKARLAKWVVAAAGKKAWKVRRKRYGPTGNK
jgi:hypothetical protein